MTVILSEYRKNEYRVESDGVLKCKHMPEDKARVFASRLAGGDDYVDETSDKPKKKATKKKLGD